MTVTNDNSVNVKNCDLCTPSNSNFHVNGHAEESYRNSLQEKKSSEIHIKRNPPERRDNFETKSINVQKIDETHQQRTNLTKTFLCCPKDTSEQGEKFTKGDFSKLMLDISNIHLDILKYIQNCSKTIKLMPKIGDPLDSCEDYNDETRSLTEEQRTSLTKYLCDNFKQITLQHPDVPSLIHGTITFILTHRPSNLDSGQGFDLTPFLESDDNDGTDSDSGKIENDEFSNGQVFDLTPFLDSDDNIGNDDNDDTDSAMIENGGLSNGQGFDLTPFLESDDNDGTDSDSGKIENDEFSNGQVFDLTPFLDSDDNIGNDDNDDTDSAMIENGGLSNVFDLTPFLDSDDNIGNDDNDDTDSACSAMIEDGGLSNDNSIDENNDDDMDDDDEDDSNTSSCVQSYVDEIPVNREAYQLFPDKIRGDLISPCLCKQQCSEALFQDENIIYRVQHIRSDLQGYRQGEKRSTKILELMRNTMYKDKKKDRKHHFHGKIICMRKWTDLLGISLATYYRIFKLLKKDIMVVEKVRKTHYHNVKGLHAVAFMDNFIDEYGDPSPERDVMLLPDCINIKYMYDEYRSIPGLCIKERRFYQLFSENFEKIVSFVKTKNINPCDICMKVKMEMHKLKDAVKKDQLKKDLKVHLDRQRSERRDYYKKKDEACMKSKEVMSIIIDGMDQSKTNIPHFKGWTRPKCGAAALKTHITGCLVHGSQLYLYTDLLQWPHDPNLTITCLVNAITSNTNVLPPKLYVQCDNCGRENKNKYVIGFLGYLCLSGYVKEAYLSFLLKGHTHEDIDQRFSVISHRLRRVNAMTLPQLQKEIESSFHDKPHQEVLACVRDVKSWLDNSLCEMSFHSFQHQFWLYCDRPNHVTLKYRKFSTDSWLPEAGQNQIELFDLDMTGYNTIPQGIPKICKQHYDDSRIEMVRHNVMKMKNFLNFQEYTWWMEFLNNPTKSTPKITRWPLTNLLKMHKIIDIPIQLVQTDDPEPSCISEMLENEGLIREIKTKEKKRKRKD
ncbi:uncharacterized protein LOC134702108 isoform X2 [Mytilus trossulus]